MQHRDQDHHDHNDQQAGRGHADRALAPPELGLSPVAGVAALGRGANPIVVVVVRGHTSSL